MQTNINITVEWLVKELSIRSKALKIMLNAYRPTINQAKEIELEKLKEAYSMGRMGKSIKEFNETFKQQDQ
jgi:hypothetical protein